MALKWRNTNPKGQAKWFNCRGYLEGFIVASNLAKHELSQNLKVDSPEIKRAWKILSCKFRGTDLSGKEFSECFDDKVHELNFFLSSTGEYGIALTEVQENDFICRLKDTEIALIIRQKSDHYPLVSVAVISSSVNDVMKFGGLPKITKGDTLNFRLDSLTPQALTCPIEFVEGILQWDCHAMEDAIFKLVMDDATNKDFSQHFRLKPTVV